MKRKYYRGITWAIVVLLCSVMGFGQIHGQGADRQKHDIGIRLKPGKSVPIYGDKGGILDEGTIRTLTNAFYITVLDGVDAQVTTTGKSCKKIHLPGPLPNNRELGKYTKARESSAGLTPTDWGKDFWIEESLLEGKNEDKGLFISEYSYSRFSIGVLSVPFKYRFSYNSSEHQLGAESSIGLSMAVDFYRSKTFDERFSAVLGAGLTSINPNGVFDDSTSAKVKNIPGMTVCFGVLGFIQRAQVGIIYGYDFADSDWTFDRKPWVAISFGFAFFNPDSEGNGNSKK